MAETSRVLIVEARFHDAIADDLFEGATRVLDEASVLHDRLPVPGVFEVPGAIRLVVRARAVDPEATAYDGFVALGCVIRGETDHYDHICRQASRALMDLAVHDGLALGFGILTCGTEAQARIRASPDGKNKGAEAARACLRMIEIKCDLRRPRP